MTTEREYQEWKKKRPKFGYKSPQNKPGFLWLLGLLVVSAFLSLRSYQPTPNLPIAPSSSSTSTSIQGEQI